MLAGLTALTVALAIAAAWGVVSVRFGPTLGWVDEPDDPALKAHLLPAVPLGGVGVFLAVHTAMLLTGRFDPTLLLASGLLVLIGLVDDRTGVSPPVRLSVEGVAGLILGFSAQGDSWIRAVLIAILVVVAVNSVNLLDGLDGLAGLSGTITAVGVVVLAVVRDSSPVFGLALAGALAGFLFWNWHPARIFLGDNGAYVLAAFVVHGMVEASRSLGELAVAAAMFGVFFFDMAATLLRRVISDQPLFSRDRLHLYDRLIERGLTIPGVALVAGALQATYIAVVILMDKTVPVPVAILSLLGIGAVTVVALVRVLGATRPGDWRSQ
ncbi:MAG TPA: MraY family glycosyltransferase [Acidimicrobiia bacterium]|nr:MraY family glycosyltransferase [Acidimicrobiia bacterium]